MDIHSVNSPEKIAQINTRYALTNFRSRFDVLQKLRERLYQAELGAAKTEELEVLIEQAEAEEIKFAAWQLDVHSLDTSSSDADPLDEPL